MISNGDSTPSYDADGNQTTDQSGATLQYTPWDQILDWTASEGGGHPDAPHRPPVAPPGSFYIYDALGRRVYDNDMAGGGGSINYYSSWEVIEQHNYTGTLTMQYVWSPA